MMSKKESMNRLAAAYLATGIEQQKRIAELETEVARLTAIIDEAHGWNQRLSTELDRYRKVAEAAREYRCAEEKARVESALFWRATNARVALDAALAAVGMKVE